MPHCQSRYYYTRNLASGFVSLSVFAVLRLGQRAYVFVRFSFGLFGHADGEKGGFIVSVNRPKTPSFMTYYKGRKILWGKYFGIHHSPQILHQWLQFALQGP